MTAGKDVNRVNGINLNVLKETVRAIESDPELGQCKFRARNKWIDANHNCTTSLGEGAYRNDVPRSVMMRNDDFEIQVCLKLITGIPV